MKLIKILVPAALIVLSSSAFAQSGNTGSTGVSGGIGSDFAASNVGGSNQKTRGGLAKALEAAFTGAK